MPSYLKPCPFCGMKVEPSEEWGWGSSHYYSIRHRCADGFGILLIETTAAATLEELKRIWNTRHEEKKENADEGGL